MNKKVFGALFVIGVVAVCGLLFAYQYTKQTDGTSAKNWILYDNMDTSAVSIEGKIDTTEYPYGYNVGAILDDKIGEAILITPGTSIEIKDYNVQENDDLYLSYAIHPWVSEKSDGSLLKLNITSKHDNQEYVFEVGEKTEQNKINLEMFYDTKVDITVSIDKLENQDEICDWVVLRDFAITSESYVFSVAEFYEKGYVRSATYFSDEWPLNFWNSEWDNLDEELEQIKNDGFESIIIVIPWREFQPEMEPVSYNDYAFENLNILMSAAQKQGLGVYARIGYTWDFYEDENDDIINRFCRLLGEKTVRDAWNAYVEKMYATLSQYECFREGFLTWEDFWNTLGICDIEDENERIEKAEYVGFQEWIQENYSIEDYNTKYGTAFSDYEAICVPQRTEPAMYAMYEFYDDFLMDILLEGQKVFPNLSMEVRMDWDVVYKTDGAMDYYKHTDTFSCMNSTYTATMYGIPMGFENKGERVSAEQGIEKTEYILQQLKQNNQNKPVFVEQFIFVDNTPKFKDNAQIRDEELNSYLEKVSDILLEHSEGYGIWTYRNYCGNMLYNSQFALGNVQWSNNESAEIRYDEKTGSNVCYLGETGYITQKVPIERNHFDSEKYTIQIDVKDVVKEGKLKVSMGANMETVSVEQTGVLNLVIDRNEEFDLTIMSEGCEIVIDNIKLFTQVQQGFLYDEANRELECIKGIRALNKKLEDGELDE